MKYLYTAKTKEGNLQKGTIEADDLNQVSKLLREKNLLILDVKKESESLWNFMSKKVSAKDKIIFTKEIAVMIKAGLALFDSLQCIQQQATSKLLARTVGQIIADLKGGLSFHQALAKHPKIFSRYYCSIVASGEKSGKLDDVLTKMSLQMENDADLYSRIRGAMIYPILISFALVGVIVLILIYVIPQLQSIFSELGANLPVATKILIWLSVVFRKYSYLVVIFCALLYIGIRWLVKTPKGLLFWDLFKLKMPIFGPLLRKIYLARFTRTMAMLILAGLPMLEIFKTLTEVVTNESYRQSLDHIGQEVGNGAALALAVKDDPNFPPMVTNLISVGEKTGNLEFVLNTLADFYEKEVSYATANLSSMIEPILIMVMGVGVAFVVISVIVPIYGLANII
jgi:type IV pilus assembly protein PilC